mgnify:CR=1 FL=1
MAKLDSTRTKAVANPQAVNGGGGHSQRGTHPEQEYEGRIFLEEPFGKSLPVVHIFILSLILRVILRIQSMPLLPGLLHLGRLVMKSLRP